MKITGKGDFVLFYQKEGKATKFISRHKTKKEAEDAIPKERKDGEFFWVEDLSDLVL